MSLETPLTVTEFVRVAIRDRILGGRYLLGAKLDQQALAEEFGVSAIPVRESLRQLEAEGLVRIVPRRGAFVTDLSVDELEEVYLIREHMEELATQLAVPHLSPTDLRRLGEILEQMEEKTAERNPSALLHLNRSFHFLIYQASRRQILLQIIEGLWSRSALIRLLYTYLPERASLALAEHRAIYQACRDRDAITAGKAVRHNIRQTIEL